MSREPHPAFPSASSLPPISSNLAMLPNSVDQVRNLILTCPDYTYLQEAVIPTLDELLELTREKDWKQYESILGLQGQRLDALTEDDMQRHSAGLLYVLIVRLNIARRSSIQEISVELFNACARLAMKADAVQLKMCPTRAFLRLAQRHNQTSAVVAPLWSLVRIATNQGCLSGVHAVYLEACLVTRSFDIAIRLIEETILDVTRHLPNYLEIITYYHHAGHIAAAVGNFEIASALFSIAVSVPTNTASAIQVSAAKRAILCELLSTGKYIQFPRYTAAAVTRAIDKHAQSYVKLGKAFEKRDWGMVNEHARTRAFTDDYNTGLLAQVLASQLKREILQISKTYSRLTLLQLADKAGLKGDVAAVTLALQEMIASGSIQAVLDNSTVTFLDDDIQNDPQTLRQLEQVQGIARLLEQELLHGNRKLTLDRKYLQKQVAILDSHAGAKGNNKPGRFDEFEELMAAEEAGGAGGRKRGGKVGNDMGDVGF